MDCFASLAMTENYFAIFSHNHRATASGGRSALSGKVLKDMGYAHVYNLGAFKDWAENGGAVEPGL